MTSGGCWEWRQCIDGSGSCFGVVVVVRVQHVAASLVREKGSVGNNCGSDCGSLHGPTVTARKPQARSEAALQLCYRTRSSLTGAELD